MCHALLEQSHSLCKSFQDFALYVASALQYTWTIIVTQYYLCLLELEVTHTHIVEEMCALIGQCLNF
jgi:hypothetical protein